MSEFRVKGTDLTSIADAIRTKGGASADLSFPDGFVSAVQSIPSGGGSTLITKSITANGTYAASSDNADGYSSVTVAVPSKLVTGTFTGEIAGAAMDITLDYSGNGYPVAALIYPSDGPYKQGSTWYTTVQKSAIGIYSMVKQEIGTTPSYSNAGTNDYGYVLAMFKSSDSDPTAMTDNKSANTVTYRDINASATYADAVRFRAKDKMTVYIAGTSYGFMKDLPYTYQIMYSE